MSRFFLPKKFLQATYSKRFAAVFSTPRTKAADLFKVRLARLDLSVCLWISAFLSRDLSLVLCLSLSLSLSPRVCPKTVQCKPTNANKSSRKRGTSYARTVTRNFARNLPETHKFYFTPQKLFITSFFLIFNYGPRQRPNNDNRNRGSSKHNWPHCRVANHHQSYSCTSSKRVSHCWSGVIRLVHCRRLVFYFKHYVIFFLKNNHKYVFTPCTITSY